MKSYRHTTRYIIGHVLLFIPYHLLLKFLIVRNLRMRAISAKCKKYEAEPLTPNGKYYGDEWYWADSLCGRYGFIPNYYTKNDNRLWKYFAKRVSKLVRTEGVV